MYLNHFESSKEARLKQILHTLESVHGIKMDMMEGHGEQERILRECQHLYEQHRDKLIKESPFNAYMQNPDYAKSLLIIEAVKLVLTEIAPKRRRKKMDESMSTTNEKQAPATANLASQLSHIAAKKIPQDSEGAAAFSNVLASISDKIAYKKPMDGDERLVWDWMMSLPRPINVSDMVKDGVAKFGHDLAAKRNQEISKMPRVDVSEEGKDQDGDGDKDFADIQVARMVASGMPKKVAIAKTSDKSYNKESKETTNPLSAFKRKNVQGLYLYDHFEDKDGNWIQVKTDKTNFVFFDKSTGKKHKFDSAAELKDHVRKFHGTSESIAEGIGPDAMMPVDPQKPAVGVGKAHHYEYQASMARSELYRNAKYAMSRIKQVDPKGEIQPWIAGSLTKAANLLDKVYHYLDYYKKFEPQELPEDDGGVELGETSGSITRQNLMMIMEYSIKLFEMIKPGDKLEGWVAMKLTTASECVSSCKHYMDYVQFEQHAMDDHFAEGSKASKKKVAESLMLSEQEDLAKASTIIAAKEMSGKVQDIAEDLAKLSVEELMPLVDIMRGQFGPEAASGFNQSVKSALEQLLDLSTKTKETMDDAIDTLSKGGIPAEVTDIEADGEIDQSTDDGTNADDSDIAKDLEALGGEGGGEEGGDEPDASPLGREKKDELTESKKVNEKWGTKMNTAKKDVGKWDGWTLDRLKARKKKLMDKKDRSDAEQKEVKQIDFAIRAKQKDKWGKVNEEISTQATKPSSTTKPTTSDDLTVMAKDGKTADKKNMTLQQKKAAEKAAEVLKGANLEEKAVSQAQQKAAGIALAAKKGDLPKNKLTGASKEMAKMSTKELEKFASTKRSNLPKKVKEARDFIEGQAASYKNTHGDEWKSALYAAAWKKYGDVSNGYVDAQASLTEARKELASLETQLAEHRKDFKAKLAEGLVKDPLKMGYGLEGDSILDQIAQVNKTIAESKSKMRSMMQEGVIGMLKGIELLNKADALEDLKTQTPYGVIYQTQSGKKAKKMFESAEARDYWVDFKSDQISSVRLINPETIDQAIARTKRD